MKNLQATLCPPGPPSRKRKLGAVDATSTSTRPRALVDWTSSSVKYNVDMVLMRTMQKRPDSATLCAERDVAIDLIDFASLELLLLSDTFMLAATYLDRFLCLAQTTDAKDMLVVASASVWVAAKYEEVYPPNSRELVNTVNRGRFGVTLSSTDTLIAAEARLLSTLSFRLTVMTPLTCYGMLIEGLESIEKRLPKPRKQKLRKAHSLCRDILRMSVRWTDDVLSNTRAVIILAATFHIAYAYVDGAVDGALTSEMLASIFGCQRTEIDNVSGCLKQMMRRFNVAKERER